MNKPCAAIEPYTINYLTRHCHERRRIDRSHDWNAARRKLHQGRNKLSWERAEIGRIFLLHDETNIMLNEHFHASRREPVQSRLSRCLYRLGVLAGCGCAVGGE